MNLDKRSAFGFALVANRWKWPLTAKLCLEIEANVTFHPRLRSLKNPNEREEGKR